MGKKVIALLMVTVMMATCFCCCKKKDDNDGLTKLVLNEVAHSIFYAPQYVAIEKGYFEEEGLKIELVNGGGADNVMTALVSGNADVGFMGSEASVYIYNEGAADYAVNFAQLTQRAGNFLVGKEKDEDFRWEKLKGKTVLGGRAGGMPQWYLNISLERTELTRLMMWI